MFNTKKQTANPVNEDRVKVRLQQLLDLAKTASGLKLRKSRVKSSHSGGYISKIKGRGMEFDETRLYQPGDDIRSIDWRVTARTGKTHTKLYREERERPVFISVDKRPTMNFATRGVFKSVQAAKLASVLAWLAYNHGDRVGGQLYTTNHCVEIKPQNGRQSVLRFFNHLLTTLPENQATLSLHQITARLSRHVRPGSLVYLISDFRGLDDKTESYIAKMALHCDVVLVFIYDPLESHLPQNGQYRFTDTHQEVTVDTADKQRIQNYHQRFIAHRQQLEKLAKKMNLGFIPCATSDDIAQVLR